MPRSGGVVLHERASLLRPQPESVVGLALLLALRGMSVWACLHSHARHAHSTGISGSKGGEDSWTWQQVHVYVPPCLKNTRLPTS